MIKQDLSNAKIKIRKNVLSKKKPLDTQEDNSVFL